MRYAIPVKAYQLQTLGGEMAKDNAQSSFQRGVMSLLILSLLDQKDMYGYQIVHSGP